MSNTSSLYFELQEMAMQDGYSDDELDERIQKLYQQRKQIKKVSAPPVTASLNIKEQLNETTRYCISQGQTSIQSSIEAKGEPAF